MFQFIRSTRLCNNFKNKFSFVLLFFVFLHLVQRKKGKTINLKCLLNQSNFYIKRTNKLFVPAENFKDKKRNKNVTNPQI